MLVVHSLCRIVCQTGGTKVGQGQERKVRKVREKSGSTAMAILRSPAGACAGVALMSARVSE